MSAALALPGGLQFDAPWMLLALPLAALPLWRGLRDAAHPVPWLALVPADLPSRWIGALIRGAAVLAIAAVVAALAGPHRHGEAVPRVGRGAEIVLVIDRSSSMDEGFRGQGRDGLIRNLRPAEGEETKASVARDVISRFVSGRDHDSFAMVLFSVFPIAFMPFTQKQDVVHAAIDASGIGRGLGDTDIGLAMQAAAEMFDDRPYLGSRVVVLVSDGGARLDEATRRQLAATLRRNHVGLYWIYLRGQFGERLRLDNRTATQAEIDSLPEQSLHDYFSGLGIPYRAYEAVQVESVRKALEDLARLEQHPIQYTERQPRTDDVPLCLAVALGALGLVLLSRGLVVPPLRAGERPAPAPAPAGRLGGREGLS